MPQYPRSVVVSIVALLLAGCGGDGNDGSDGTDGTNGTNGANGSDGADAVSSLVDVVNEPAGAHCSYGGQRIDTGADTNSNGVLDASEVSSARYVCNGSAGSSAVTALVSIVAESAGANCTYGGSKVTSGPDTDGNGTLDSGEVSATNYVCNGVPALGISSWVEITGAVQAAANIGYIANGVDQVTITLPANPAMGDVISISGRGAGGWKIAQNAGQTIRTSNLVGGTIGGNWSPTESVRSWRFAAFSSDGVRLVATTYNDFIYTSTDSGVTWTPRDAARNWTGVASSADGTRLAATEFDGQIYTSTDAGATWTAHGPVGDWRSIASSADGTKLVAVGQYSLIYISADAGATWTATGPLRSWRSVASSADGTRLIATSANTPLYISSDSGATWTETAHSANWSQVASSADGMRLLASVNGSYLYTSTNGGGTWTRRENPRPWGNGVGSSADGTRLIANAGNLLFMSTDSGVTWTQRPDSGNWYGVTASYDGSRFVALGTTGRIDLSTPTPRTATSLGVSGSISGRATDTIDLQYIGNGTFTVRGSAGVFDIH